MLKKRVIFTLLYNDGSFVLSRNFRLQRVGDIRWLQKNYNFSHISFFIDELIVLDVTRGIKNEELFCEHVRLLTKESFIPIAAGGGIRSLERAKELLHSGADKVVVNTLISESPKVIEEIAIEYGRQCIVASVDVKKINNQFTVWTNNGTIKQMYDLSTWLDNINNLPIGELYLNSMDKDGTGQGYHFDLLDAIPNQFSIPVILAGGAGKHGHLSSGLDDKRVDAVATAHLFNFVGDGLERARNKLLHDNYNLAKWDVNKINEFKERLL